MSVRVEFYGLPRKRAQIDALDVDAGDLADLLRQVSTQLPHFAAACLENGRLRDGVIANLNGKRFTTDPKTPLRSGDSVLILSADAGG